MQNHIPFRVQGCFFGKGITVHNSAEDRYYLSLGFQTYAALGWEMQETTCNGVECLILVNASSCALTWLHNFDMDGPWSGVRTTVCTSDVLSDASSGIIWRIDAPPEHIVQHAMRATCKMLCIQFERRLQNA